jgi:hypothetical protein
MDSPGRTARERAEIRSRRGFDGWLLHTLEAEGAGPFAHVPPSARRRAAARAKRANRVCDARPRHLRLTRPSGAGRPRGSRRTSSRAGPDDDEGDPEPDLSGRLHLAAPFGFAKEVG